MDRRVGSLTAPDSTGKMEHGQPIWRRAISFSLGRRTTQLTALQPGSFAAGLSQTGGAGTGRAVKQAERISFDTGCTCGGRRRRGWLRSGTAMRLHVRMAAACTTGTEEAASSKNVRPGWAGQAGRQDTCLLADVGTEEQGGRVGEAARSASMCSGGWLSWADIVGRPQGRGSRAARAGHGQGCTNDCVPQYDGQGSRNLCDDETLSTISHSELRQPMSGEGPPEGRVVARAVDEHGVRLLG